MTMPELSLHVLDIAQNALSAGADLIEITITAEPGRDFLSLSVKDNGVGMDQETLSQVLSPFSTSRTTRKVGLGIPFFKDGAIACGGDFALESKKGVGTHICASYQLSHIDRPPVGNMADTLLGLVVCNAHVDFVCKSTVGQSVFEFDTREIKQVLGEVPLSTPEVISWLRECLAALNCSL